MKKSILALGKTLNKTEQKSISGGLRWVGYYLDSDGKCWKYVYNDEELVKTKHADRFADRCS